MQRVNAGQFVGVVTRNSVISELGMSATTGLLSQPRMMDDGHCGAVGEMRIGRGNRSARRKPVPVPVCPPHDLTWARTLAATNRLNYVAALSSR
jgi:hypothetical protein